MTKICHSHQKNKDNLCFGVALVVAICDVLRKNNDKGAEDKWESLRRYSGPQKKEAETLYKTFGVKPGPCGIDEIKKFQKLLAPDFGINVFVLNNQAGQQCIYKGSLKAPMQL